MFLSRMTVFEKCNGIYADLNIQIDFSGFSAFPALISLSITAQIRRCPKKILKADFCIQDFQQGKGESRCFCTMLIVCSQSRL